MCIFLSLASVRYSKGISYVGQGITSRNVVTQSGGGASSISRKSAVVDSSPHCNR